MVNMAIEEISKDSTLVHKIKHVAAGILRAANKNISDEEELTVWTNACAWAYCALMAETGVPEADVLETIRTTFGACLETLDKMDAEEEVKTASIH